MEITALDRGKHLEALERGVEGGIFIFRLERSMKAKNLESQTNQGLPTYNNEAS